MAATDDQEGKIQIIKPGSRKIKEETWHRMTCFNCDCEFVYRSSVAFALVTDSKGDTWYCVHCPEKGCCRRIAIKSKCKDASTYMRGEQPACGCPLLEDIN